MKTAQTIWNRDALDLLRTMLRLKTTAQARRFLRDLMTTDEIRMIVDRWRVARMLDQGCSYKSIAAKTGISSRTIARISRWLRRGEGGYKSMLQKVQS